MSMTVTDNVLNGQLVPVVGATVSAAPTYQHDFRVQGGGAYAPTQAPWPSGTTTGAGMGAVSLTLSHTLPARLPSVQTSIGGVFTFTLPWPSEFDPVTTTWAITMPDGSVWTGFVPEGVAGPVTMNQLKNTYAWTAVSILVALRGA